MRYEYETRSKTDLVLIGLTFLVVFLLCVVWGGVIVPLLFSDADLILKVGMSVAGGGLIGSIGALMFIKFTFPRKHRAWPRD